MVATEEIVELLMIVAHRSRLAFEDLCSSEALVASDVLLLRALRCLGDGSKRREVADALGWCPGRVTQVVDRLVAKSQVRRMRRLYIETNGASEAERAGLLLQCVAEHVLEGLREDECEALLASLRRVAANSERLWRIRRSACE